MEWIEPDWPVPPGVRALATTRRGGLSQGSYAGFNLGDRVGDHPAHVAGNRAYLRQRLKLPAEPHWLHQVHGCAVAEAGEERCDSQADAVIATRPGVVCAVLTADCLPLLLADRAGGRVAAVHAGWRGLAGGVIEAALARLERPPEALLGWLGPAIGPSAFEVGEEVRDRFLAENGTVAARAFEPAGPGTWRADLYRLARQRLARAGVTKVYGGDLCTFSDRRRFFSYRRDGITGRMASLIWLTGST